MEPKEMAKWAYSHACDKCHAGELCNLSACISAKDIADFLERHERLEGTDSHGNPVRGWFVADKV